MIRGVGLDLVEVARMERAISKEHFCARVFTEAERELLQKKRAPAESAAGFWAAKEAALKALGTGIGPVRLTEVEVTKTESGQPVLTFSGKAKSAFEALGARRAFVSITHSGGIAAAQVILED